MTVDDLPANASAITTGNYYPGFNRLAIWYGDGGCYGWFKGAEDTELTLNADQTMTSTSDGYGAGWDGTYKSFTNNGTLTIKTTESKIDDSYVSKVGFVQAGSFINNGTLILEDLQGRKVDGFQNKGAFENYGSVKVVGSSGLSGKGFVNSDIVTNHAVGTMDIAGGSTGSTYGFTGGFLVNEVGGTILATGGSGSSAAGIRDTSFTNQGILTAVGGSGSLAAGLYDVSLVNDGDATFVGSDSYSTAYGASSSSSVKTTNNAGATINVQGSSGTAVGWRDAGTTVNDGTMNVTANAAGGWTIYGAATNNGVMNLFGSDSAAAVSDKKSFVNNGTMNISSNGLEVSGSFENNGTINISGFDSIKLNGGTFAQSSASAVIKGNLENFIQVSNDYKDQIFGEVPQYITPDGEFGEDDRLFTSGDILPPDQGYDEIGNISGFLQSKITNGKIFINTKNIIGYYKFSIISQIHNILNNSNVEVEFVDGYSSDQILKRGYVNVTTSYLKDNWQSHRFYLYPVSVGDEKDSTHPKWVVKSEYGLKQIKTNAIDITYVDVYRDCDYCKAELQLLGDGTWVARLDGEDATITVGKANKLTLGSDHSAVTAKQGGTVGTVNLAGALVVSKIKDQFDLTDLRLSETAQVTNAGHTNVEQLAFNTRTATVMNSGVMRVAAVTASQVGSTLKNTGTYAQTDLSAFGDIQNKGTLKTGTLTVGAADKLINGGTILAEKITIDGLLQNRNGTFALGTAAVAKYLEKHLDLAQQLKDLGETLPTSVENLLAAQADAEAASLTTLELADGERPVESDDETSETTESTDFASLFAEIQAAKAPQGRLATREGRLAFAGFSTYADNRAQLERQLQSGLSSLWVDVIASQSEMDGYKANRSGIAVGLQGTNDVGFTFGVAARYSDGKLKGDALTSENWTSAGGSTYAAWTNDDAFVSGFIGYDNLKTKGSDKLTNDVVSVGVKSGLKLDVGPVHVTPFVGGEVVHQKVKGLEAATTYRFPMGVGLSGQYETYGSWQVHPSLEVAFVPQAGDKVIDVTDKVDSCFAGNYAVESRLGIAVEKKNLMLGVNYHGSAGDAGLRSHSLQANVKYRF